MSAFTDVIKKIAPAVATVLGGPFAGLALEVLGPALGITDATQDKIQQALSGPLNGEQLAAIKKAEMELQVRLKELGIKLEELEVKKEEIAAGDRMSARQLFAQGFKLIGWISILTIAGFFGAVYYMLTEDLKGMSPEQIMLYGTILGYLAANTQQIYNYFFGTSAGSDKKNEMLDAVLKNGNGKN